VARLGSRHQLWSIPNTAQRQSQGFQYCCRSNKDEAAAPQNVLSKVLISSKHDKWGFVIYRCTYEDDQAWDRFQQVFRERKQQALQRSDTPKIADSHEWTFVDDRTALDGASRPQLRERFNEWAAHAMATEQP
jgi:hypothetical protein